MVCVVAEVGVEVDAAELRVRDILSMALYRIQYRGGFAFCLPPTTCPTEAFPERLTHVSRAGVPVSEIQLQAKLDVSRTVRLRQDLRKRRVGKIAVGRAEHYAIKRIRELSPELQLKPFVD
jgi:hypothetical protein